MKGKIVIFVFGGVLFLMFQSFKPYIISGAVIPDKVNRILKSSCFDCHTSGARNKDAKEALNFEQWDEYRLTKKIGLLNNIGKMVKEEKMPPERYLNFNPDRKLNKEERELIIKWADDESDELMGDQ